MENKEFFTALAFYTDGTLETVDLPKEGWFNKAKEMLGIETADLPCRKIGGRTFDFLCDDEGLLVSNPQPTLITDNNEILLVGNILITHPYEVDDDGNAIMEDLTDEEIRHIKKHISVFNTVTNGIIAIITGGDYDV